MSHYTQLQLSWDDAENASGTTSVEDILSIAREYLREQDWSEEILEDIRKSCASSSLETPGFNRVFSFGVIDLLRYVSRGLPDTIFYAKGSGEEFWDIWIREFKGGVAVTERGPFDDIAPPIPEDMLASAKEAAEAAQERKRPHKGFFAKLLKR